MKITICDVDVDRLIVKEMKAIIKDKYCMVKCPLEEDRMYYRKLIKAAKVVMEHYRTGGECS